MTVPSHNRNFKEELLQATAVSQFRFNYLTFVYIKPASTTCFYWTGFSECSYNPLMAVLEHEYEYSKTVFFKLEYTYSCGYTKNFQRYKHGEL